MVAVDAGDLKFGGDMRLAGPLCDVATPGDCMPCALTLLKLSGWG